MVKSPDQRSPALRRHLPGKIPSPPCDPRRAICPDDYGAKDSGQGKKKLRKRLEDLDSPRVLQAEYDKRHRREELLHAINKEAKGEPLSAVLCVARAKSSKKAAPLEEKRVDIQQNDSVDQARLTKPQKLVAPQSGQCCTNCHELDNA